MEELNQTSAQENGAAATPAAEAPPEGGDAATSLTAANEVTVASGEAAAAAPTAAPAPAGATAAGEAAAGEAGRTRRKIREGVVVSDKMDKTAVVAVVRLKRHPLYGRVHRVTRHLQAHDEGNECHVGDRVRIMETRPLSRHKHWRVLQIVERAS